MADVQWAATGPELPHKESQTIVRTLLQSSGSRHAFEGACAGREVVFITVSMLNRLSCDWAVADCFGSV